MDRSRPPGILPSRGTSARATLLSLLLSLAKPRVRSEAEISRGGDKRTVRGSDGDEPVESATTLPVATARQRLRGRPGRPRTKPCGDNRGDSREPARTQVRVPPACPTGRTQDSPSCAPSRPRLLTRQEAANYLNLSSDMIDRLTQQRELPRVQLVLGNRNVRKVPRPRPACRAESGRLSPSRQVDFGSHLPPPPKNQLDRTAWEALQPQETIPIPPWTGKPSEGLGCSCPSLTLACRQTTLVPPVRPFPARPAGRPR